MSVSLELMESSSDNSMEQRAVFSHESELRQAMCKEEV